MQWIEEWIGEKEVETSVDSRTLAVQIKWGERMYRVEGEGVLFRISLFFKLETSACF